MSECVARQNAEAMMAAWAEVTTAPALALVHDQRSNRYRTIGADSDGTLVLRRSETLVDMDWTPHSKGITSLTLKNAYSVTCCYEAYYARDDNIFVPHGATDLAPALDRAIEDANDSSDWRSVDHVGDTFIDAIAEDRDVHPWTGDIPVPEDLSQHGPTPIILIRMAGGRIDDVKLVRGEAHVVVANRDGEAVDRGPHLHLHDDQGEFLLTNWTGPDDQTCLPTDLIRYLGIRTDATDSQIPYQS